MDKLTYIICGKLYNGIDAEFKENYKILVKNRFDRSRRAGYSAARVGRGH